MSSLLKTVKQINVLALIFNLSSVSVNSRVNPVQKSIAKTIIKSGTRLYENGKATLAEIGEIVNTLVVEVKTEKITAAQMVKVSVKD
ncbi:MULTISPECIES: DUF5132 domain-containing protein [Okeania]|uniref:DUF5132 domain-containing protein n=1 Tax=Okeania hirsuta TaxID=1458930 RepID=A0A3N6NX76_9CYAN|nr:MULTISPECIES: DUF5132 domain-containing protein [Okeania]NES74431.1 DUF5132 domain-containing protein [Okeania sp. SIO1H4]NES88303.1 DUF5132 domain-containing protein [Okeania sp. SIO2B9]NET18164.1 DUF5132 domain-containing protein [Okeania sp. SIO1H5]NET77421.1 DUF5132 domain-containing protein [Okeania sp. SIO1F9]NET92394.1 DUF5132 domain-containing protein [Okeania sp. SIO1H2]